MHRDPFAPISRRKLTVYGCVAVVLILAGCSWLFYLDTPLWRVLLIGGFTTFLFSGVVGATIWLTSGRRSEVSTGPTGVRLPVRFAKALPYIFGAVIFFQFLKLLEVLISR